MRIPFVVAGAFALALGLASIADASHDPDTNLLSGPLQLALSGIADASDDPAVDAAIEDALVTLSTDHGGLAKSIKKFQGTFAKLDKVVGDDPDYVQQADLFLALLATTSAADANFANLALADDVIRNPLGPAAKLIQKVAKSAERRDAKLSKEGATRKQKLKALLKAQKFWESLIRKYG